MEAVLCPICRGEGKVCKGILSTTGGNIPVLEDCPGCGVFPHGKGWVVIPDHVVAFPKKAG